MRTSARLWLAVVTAVALVATGLGVLQAPASAVGIGTSITYASGVFTVAVASSGETVHFSASGTTLSITSDVGTTADAGAQSQGFSSSTGPGVANSGSQTNPTTIQRMFVNGAAGTQTIVFDGGTIGRAIVGANLDIENVSFATAASTFNTAVAGVPALEVTADAVAVNQSVSGNADIVFSADSMTLGAAVNAATVTLQQKGTTSRAVTIGGGATGLGLSDAELGQVAAGVLRIGRTDNPGTLTVDGSVTTHAGYSTLSLRSGGAISQSSNTLAVSNLAVTTNGPVGLTNVANAVGTLAASVTGSNQGFGLKSAVTTLTVGTVDGVIGITTNGGAVNPLENNLVAGALTVSNNIATGGGDVTLFADTMTFTGTVSAGTGTLYLDTELLNRPITLGTTDATKLSFTDSALGQLTARVLRVGDENTDTGGLVIAGTVTRHAGWSTLDLRQNSPISQTASLSVANLVARTNGSNAMTLTNAGNDVDVIAGFTTAGNFTYADSNALTIGTVVDRTSITTSSGTITVTAAGALTSTDAGSATGHTYVVDGSKIVRDSAAAINYSTPASVTVTGGNAADTFTVTPSSDIAFTVNGNPPTTSPGDTLTVDLTGTTSPTLSDSGGSGNYTFGNRQAVNFTSIESVNGPDLAITKTDGKTSAAPGAQDTYTIVATNNGPAAASGVKITDTFPATFTSVSYTAVATGTATGFTASGTGNIADTASMPAGSTITYTVTGTITSSATGSIANTATIGIPGITESNTTNNSQTDTDTLTPQADLRITKTDGKTSAIPGTQDTYTIVVSNNGPSNVTGASVTDTFPATFTGVTFTATQLGGATGFTANGSGNISDIVNMPSGASITYTATGTISPSATGSLANTASVSAPSGTTELDGTNNQQTDTDTLTPRTDLVVTKTGPSPVTARTNFNYTIKVGNLGPSTATGVTMTDTLPPDFHIVSVSAPGYNCPLPTSFKGGTLTCSRTSAMSPSATAQDTITVTGNFQPTTTATQTERNTARVSSTTTDLATTNNTSFVDTTIACQPGGQSGSGLSGGSGGSACGGSGSGGGVAGT